MTPIPLKSKIKTVLKKQGFGVNKLLVLGTFWTLVDTARAWQ